MPLEAMRGERLQNKRQLGNWFWVFFGLFGLTMWVLSGFSVRQMEEARMTFFQQFLHIAKQDREEKAEEAVYESEKRIALTFDDGPHPVQTKKLLEGLKERGMKATFFVTGEHALQYPKLIKQMQDDGHLIGNHTYHHVQLGKVSRDVYFKEILDTNEVIEKITGSAPSFIRPPYGSWDKNYEKELNMIPVLWNIDPLDWCTNDANKVYQRVLSSVKDQDIILMHDSYETTVTATFLLVDELTKKGYKFVTVDELLFE